MDGKDCFFVPTRCSKINRTHDVVVFESNKKQKKIHQEDESNKQKSEELDMKQARFEIYKFAKSGLKNPDKYKSDMELAIKLGAIPDKNKALNYKKLKEERLKEKKELEKKSQLCDLGKTLRPNRFSNKKKDPKGVLRKKRKIGSGILNDYGSVKRK